MPRVVPTAILRLIAVPLGHWGERGEGRMLRQRKRLALVGSLLAVGCVAVGIAYAAIPNGNVITACYKVADGNLRVIDVAQTPDCKQGETKLTWGQQGPQGLKGDKGEKGDKGDCDRKAGTTGSGRVSGRVVVAAPTTGSGSAIAVCPEGKVYLAAGSRTCSDLQWSGQRDSGSTPRNLAMLGRDRGGEGIAICATVG